MSVTEKFYDTLLAPVITEKSTMAGENNQVVFRVPLDATKTDISAAVEGLFNVKVKAVNTLRVKGKRKMFRGNRYTRSTVKKAIVTLADGHSIDVSTGL
ncbi:MAG: 50S ribosomal protein L23 [Pseudomonadota bacterium]